MVHIRNSKVIRDPVDGILEPSYGRQKKYDFRVTETRNLDSIFSVHYWRNGLSNEPHNLEIYGELSEL